MPHLTLIVAATTKNGIGRGGTMPWHIPKDLAYFGRVTTRAPAGQSNVVLMGRKTWESIPYKHRPLKNRINVVLSQSKDYDLVPHATAAPSPTSTAHLCCDLEGAVEAFRPQDAVHRLFVIGGSSLYQQALALGSQHSKSLHVDRILITRLHNPEFECDVFFPDVLAGTEWKKASHEELCAWVGFQVPPGIQTECGIEFEFQMWITSPEHLETTAGDH